jgi:centrosomal CEP192-like protein
VLRRPPFLSIVSLLPFSACTCQDTINQLNASVVVEPAMLDFGKVGLDSTKTVKLTIRNKGSFPLDVESFSAGTPFLAPTSTVAKMRIQTASSIQVSVGFHPSQLGPAMDQLEFSTSDPKSKAVTVPLVGIGIQASVKVEPSMIDFGDVLYNSMTTAKSAMITISNPGTDNFDVTAIDLDADPAGSFTVDPMMAKKTYGPGQSASFAVSFLAKGLGAVQGAIHVKTTAPDGADITVPLTAKGVGPVINLCAALDGEMETCTMNGGHPRLVFHVDKDATGGGKVRVINTGDRDLTISSVLLSGPHTAFSFSPNAPSASSTVIMPNQDSTWTVTFAPHSYMYESFFMSFINDSASHDGSSVVVEGHVKQPTILVMPERVTFTLAGSASMGSVPVQIYNCGDRPLTLGAISFMQTGGPAGGALSASALPASGTTIPPQSCMPALDPAGAMLKVDFMPSQNGIYMGTVTIPSNDPIRPTVDVTVTAAKNM